MLLTARLTALEQRLKEPAKTQDKSSLPPSKGQKPNRSDTSKTAGPRKGCLDRKGGGRSLTAEPDQVMSAKAAGCRHCGSELGEADHHVYSRYDKIELPRVSPVVTRVERYAGAVQVLRRHDSGARPRRPGGGFALRPERGGHGALPALHPFHQLPTAPSPVRTPVRPRHQRRRARRPVPPRQARLRRRYVGHPGRRQAANFHSATLSRFPEPPHSAVERRRGVVRGYGTRADISTPGHQCVEVGPDRVGAVG